MAPNWTPCKVQELIRLLSKYHGTLYYDYSTKSNQRLRKDTFENIAEQLNVPLSALKYKYFNMNNAYNTEIKKIKAGETNGFFYRPTWPWFNEYKALMDKVNDSLDSGPATEEPTDQNPHEESIHSEEDYEEEVLAQGSDTEQSADTIVVTIKQECIDSVKKGIWDVDFEETLETIQPMEPVESVASLQPIRPPKTASIKKSAKRPHNPESSVKAPVKPIVKVPVNELQTFTDVKVPVDEFQMFADNIAEQLRNMTINSARKMQTEIHIIFDEEGFPFYSPVLEDA